MAFLTLNGITCPVDLDGGSVEWEGQVDDGRSASGGYNATVQSSKRAIPIGTIPMSSRLANAWERLALGLGHRFSFVDLYSSKGLGAVTTGTVTPNGATGKFDKRLTVASSSTAAWTFGTDAVHGLTADYTLSLWHLETGVWVHYLIVRYQGNTTYYKDGVSQGTGTPGSGDLVWYAVDLTLGKITLGQVGTGHAFSEMVWHPFAIGATSGEWVTSFSSATVAHPDLPTLRAAGTLVAVNGASSLSVEAGPESVRTKPKAFAVSGVWDPGAKEVEFVLHEV